MNIYNRMVVIIHIVVAMACSVRLFLVPWNGMEGKLKARERWSHVAVHAYIPRTSTTNQVRNQESSAVHSGVEWSAEQAKEQAARLASGCLAVAGLLLAGRQAITKAGSAGLPPSPTFRCRWRWRWGKS
jgi:hypothetical protein